MKKLYLIILVSLGIASALFSQQFKAIADIDSVPEDGYFRILLSPDLISYSNSDYSDIRLFDSKGKEVPYFLKEDAFATSVTGFTEYKLLENKHLPEKKLTRVWIENPNKNIISSLGVVVRNTDITKEITLKGSDNKTDWYIIQKSAYNSGDKFNETSELITLNFPNSDYQYFEISINDQKKDPIQVLKVGYYGSQLSKGTYTQFPVKEMQQTDSSNKHSYIRIKFAIPYELSRLELEIDGPELYQRNCVVGQYVSNKNGSTFEIEDQFELVSNKPAIWETSKLNVSELMLIVENNDNPPLKFKEIKSYQLNKYAIAKLNKNEVYSIKTGNPQLSFPDYDLKYFSENIQEEITVLKTRNLSVSSTQETSKTIFSKTVLWSVIILVIGLLGFFSIKLVREMGQKE